VGPRRAVGAVAGAAERGPARRRLHLQVADRTGSEIVSGVLDPPGRRQGRDRSAGPPQRRAVATAENHPAHDPAAEGWTRKGAARS
jgi:hypothetical protein